MSASVCVQSLPLYVSWTVVDGRRCRWLMVNAVAPPPLPLLLLLLLLCIGLGWCIIGGQEADGYACSGRHWLVVIGVSPMSMATGQPIQLQQLTNCLAFLLWDLSAELEDGRPRRDLKALPIHSSSSSVPGRFTWRCIGWAGFIGLQAIYSTLQSQILSLMGSSFDVPLLWFRNISLVRLIPSSKRSQLKGVVKLYL